MPVNFYKKPEFNGIKIGLDDAYHFDDYNGFKITNKNIPDPFKKLKRGPIINGYGMKALAIDQKQRNAALI